jgi:hypothetical protein
MIKSRTWVKSIASVFRSTSEDERAMNIQLARLCVLYEDMRLEYDGAEAETIPALDRIGRDPRRFYFVRRTLATFTEIAGAVNKLNSNPEFKRLKRGFDKETVRMWDKAAKWFEANRDFLKDWRNDVGGHLLDKAAGYAVDSIHETTVGAIELMRVGNSAEAKLPFAYELVAVAMTRHKAQQTEQQFLEDSFTTLVQGFDAVRDAVHAVILERVLPRFK